MQSTTKEEAEFGPWQNLSTRRTLPESLPIPRNRGGPRLDLISLGSLKLVKTSFTEKLKVSVLFLMLLRIIIKHY